MKTTTMVAMVTLLHLALTGALFSTNAFQCVINLIFAVAFCGMLYGYYVLKNDLNFQKTLEEKQDTEHEVLYSIIKQQDNYIQELESKLFEQDKKPIQTYVKKDFLI